MRITVRGPGALIGALSQIETTLHGVGVRRVVTSRIVQNENRTGYAGNTICTLDGRRVSRAVATARLAEHYGPDEEVTIEGRMRSW